MLLLLGQPENVKIRGWLSARLNAIANMSVVSWLPVRLLHMITLMIGRLARNLGEEERLQSAHMSFISNPEARELTYSDNLAFVARASQVRFENLAS